MPALRQSLPEGLQSQPALPRGVAGLHTVADLEMDKEGLEGGESFANLRC